MTVGNAQRLEELELQVADLAAQVAQLRRHRELDRIYAEESAIRDEPPALRRVRAAAQTTTRARGQRASHLRLVSGGSR